MSESSTPAAPPLETLAMLAVLQHAADHGLPVNGIDSPVLPGSPIVVKVRPVHLEDWLDTVTLTGPATIDPVAPVEEISVMRRPATVPSPIGDVRVVLMTLATTVRRPAPLLQLVKTGAAS